MVWVKRGLAAASVTGALVRSHLEGQHAREHGYDPVPRCIVGAMAGAFEGPFWALTAPVIAVGVVTVGFCVAPFAAIGLAVAKLDYTQL